MTKRGITAKLRRKELDRLFEKIRSLDLTPPRKGWIADIRDSLGMTSAELARRLKIDASTAKRLEESEAKRSITLSSMDKAAQALGCRVEYILIPNKPLEEMVREQALTIVKHYRDPVAHTMALEDQSTDKHSAKDREDLMIDELIYKLDRELWEQRGKHK